jgi:hypothetical protein
MVGVFIISSQMFEIAFFPTSISRSSINLNVQIFSKTTKYFYSLGKEEVLQVNYK